MADETHKLQKDPPEGSREVVEHELKRQSGKADKAGKDGRTGGSRSGTAAKSNKARAKGPRTSR